jgi:hypothetical protein
MTLKVGSLSFSERLLRDDRTETLDAQIRKGRARMLQPDPNSHDEQGDALGDASY